MRSQTYVHAWTAFAASVALIGIAAAFSEPAAAGCLDVKMHKAVDLVAPHNLVTSPRFIRASYEDEGKNWDWEPAVRKAPIVGLWSFKYISEGNEKSIGFKDGNILDGGNTIWYADGNENTVSGVRDPETGSVCLGIW